MTEKQLAFRQTNVNNYFPIDSFFYIKISEKFKCRTGRNNNVNQAK